MENAELPLQNRSKYLPSFRNSVFKSKFFQNQRNGWTRV